MTPPLNASLNAVTGAVADVAARKITPTAVDDSTTFTVGLQRQGIEQETEVTIAGAAAGEGEQYTVILNGTPITYTSVEPIMQTLLLQHLQLQ